MQRGDGGRPAARPAPASGDTPRRAARATRPSHAQIRHSDQRPRTSTPISSSQLPSHTLVSHSTRSHRLICSLLLASLPPSRASPARSARQLRLPTIPPCADLSVPVLRATSRLRLVPLPASHCAPPPVTRGWAAVLPPPAAAASGLSAPLLPPGSARLGLGNTAQTIYARAVYQQYMCRPIASLHCCTDRIRPS